MTANYNIKGTTYGSFEIGENGPEFRTINDDLQLNLKVGGSLLLQKLKINNRDVYGIPPGGIAGQVLALNAGLDGFTWIDAMLEGEAPPGIPDAPADGKQYGRENNAWVVIDTGSVGEAPENDRAYIRKNGQWVEQIDNVGLSDAPINQTLYARRNGQWAEVSQNYKFLDLTDTPSSYSGQSGKIISVSSTENSLQFIDYNPNAGLSIPDFGQHLYWRILVHEVDGNSYVGINELSFKHDSDGPDLAVGGVATASSSENSNQTPNYAFDDQLSNAWFSAPGQGVEGQWIAYQFPAPVSIRYVIMAGSQDYPTTSPTNFDVQYSDNGTTWITAWNVADPGVWNRGQYRYYHSPLDLGFADLKDVPPTFVGQGGRILQVREDEVGMDFVSASLVPVGGTAGQILAKTTDVDGDIGWINQQDIGLEYPVGGAAGQVLTKKSSANNDVIWATPAVSTNELPSGGTSGQILAKRSGTSGDVQWVTIGNDLPTGGSAGQVLAKTSASNYAVQWVDPVTDGTELPSGGTTGQVLTKRTSTDGDVYWTTAQQGLTDAPANANMYARRNGTWSVVKQSYAFNELVDTPSTYLGQGGKIISVKEDETGLELIDAPSSNIGSGSLVPDYGEHLYWRILVHAITSGNRVGIQEIEFKNTSLGPDLTGTGTAIASSQEQTPAGAFDNAVNGAWFSVSGQPIDGQWIGYQFPSPVSVRYVNIMGSQDYPTQSPVNFEIQYSDDGAVWTTAWAVTDPGNWNTGQTRYYHAPVGLNFTDLDDVPPTYVGQSLRFLQVRSDEKGFNLVNLNLIPDGGVNGQILAKNSNNTGDLIWKDSPISFPEAPQNGQSYARRNGNWIQVSTPGQAARSGLSYAEKIYEVTTDTDSPLSQLTNILIPEDGGKYKITIEIPSVSAINPQFAFLDQSGQPANITGHRWSSEGTTDADSSRTTVISLRSSDYISNTASTLIAEIEKMATGAWRIWGSIRSPQVEGIFSAQTDGIAMLATLQTSSANGVGYPAGTYFKVEKINDNIPLGGSAEYPNFMGNEGKVLVVNSTEDGVEWVDSSTWSGTNENAVAFGGKWNRGNISPVVSSDYGSTTWYQASNQFNLKVGDKIEIEAYLVSNNTDISIIIGNSVAGYKVSLQIDGNFVIYYQNGTAATSIIATGTSTATRYAGSHKITFTIVLTSVNGYYFAARHDVTDLNGVLATGLVDLKSAPNRISVMTSSPTRSILRYRIVDSSVYGNEGSNNGEANYPVFENNAGKILAVNQTEDDVEWIELPESLGDAPSDGTIYGRLNGSWVEVADAGGSSLPDGGTTGQVLAKESDADGDAVWIDPVNDLGDAPEDGKIYGRKNGSWVDVSNNDLVYVSARYWRWRPGPTYVPSDWLHIAEMQVFNEQGVILTGSGTPSASQTYSSEFPPSAAFNNNQTDNGWVNSSKTQDDWLKYDFGVQVTPTRMVVSASETFATSLMSPIVVEYSDDDVEWTKLVDWDNVAQAAPQELIIEPSVIDEPEPPIVYSFAGQGVTVTSVLDPQIVQSVGGRNSSSLTLANLPAIGNTLLLVWAGATNASSPTTGTWIQQGSIVNSTQQVRYWTQVSDGSLATVSLSRSDNGQWALYEISNYGSSTLDQINDPRPPMTLSVVPGSVQIFSFEQDGSVGSSSITVAEGAVLDAEMGGTGNHQGSIGHITATSGFVNILGSLTGTSIYGMITITADGSGGDQLVTIPGVVYGSDLVTSIIPGDNVTFDYASGQLTINGEAGTGGNGTGSMQYFNGARVGLLASESSSARTGRIISWDDEILDEGGWFNPLDPMKLVVPSGVKYVQLTAGVQGNTDLAADQSIYLSIFKNTTDQSTADTNAVAVNKSSSSTYTGQGLTLSTGVLEVSPGDYFVVRINCPDTSWGLSSVGTFFSIEDVGKLSPGTSLSAISATVDNFTWLNAAGPMSVTSNTDASKGVYFNTLKEFTVDRIGFMVNSTGAQAVTMAIYSMTSTTSTTIGALQYQSSPITPTSGNSKYVEFLVDFTFNENTRYLIVSAADTGNLLNLYTGGTNNSIGNLPIYGVAGGRVAANLPTTGSMTTTTDTYVVSMNQVTPVIGTQIGEERFVASGLVSNVASGTPIITKGYNIETVTKTATGRWRVTFTNPLPSTNFGVNVSGRFDDFDDNWTLVAGIDRHPGYGFTVDSIDFNFNTSVTPNSTLYDPSYFSFEIYDPSVTTFGTGSGSENVGTGLPDGGTIGQVLTKNSSDDGDASWSDVPSTGGIADAPSDGNQYARQNGAWTEVDIPTDIVPEAPSDGHLYGRYNGGWTEVSIPSNILPEAPADSKYYARRNQSWAVVPAELPTGGAAGQVLSKSTSADGAVAWTTISTGIADAPSDGNQYARQNGAWAEVVGGAAEYPDFTGNEGKVLAVNSTEDGVEWVNQANGSDAFSFPPVTATGTGVEQNITLPVTVTNTYDVDVYVNGIHQNADEYSVSGNILTLTTNSNTALIEIRPSGGIITSPEPTDLGSSIVVANLHLANDWTPTDSVWQLVPFDTAKHDTLGVYSSSNVGRMTVPAGVTRVRITAYMAYQNSGSTRYIALVKNGLNEATNGVQAGINSRVNEGDFSFVSEWLDVVEGDWFSIMTTGNANVAVRGDAGQPIYGGASYFQMEMAASLDSFGANSGTVDQHYRFAGFFTASPEVNEILMMYVVDEDVTIPANWEGSQAKLLGTHPSSSYALSIRKNSTTEIGTLTINNDGSVVFVTTDNLSQNLVIGDAISIHAPGTTDTVTNATWLLRGIKQ